MKTIDETIKIAYKLAEQHPDLKEANLQLAHWLEELVAIRTFFKANNMEIEYKPDGSVKRTKPSGTNMYDEEEKYDNCTVQIWRNSKTGDESIGWWKNE